MLSRDPGIASLTRSELSARAVSATVEGDQELTADKKGKKSRNGKRGKILFLKTVRVSSGLVCREDLRRSSSSGSPGRSPVDVNLQSRRMYQAKCSRGADMVI